MAELVLHAPTSLSEASGILRDYGGEARAIAGGTALVLMMRQGLVRPPALVRLDHVSGLSAIAVEDGALRLGALATLRDVARSPLVQRHAPILAEACNLVGNVRVRDAATIGGNVCEADYASDPPGVLTALDARARVQGPSGQREVPISELITDFYETSLGPDELVSDVLVPIVRADGTRQSSGGYPPPQPLRQAQDMPSPARGEGAGVYLKYITRSSEDRPCVGTTAVLRLDGGGRIADLRVAVGAVAGRPLRLPEVEATAIGEQATDELFRHLGERYAEAAEPVGDVRGSADYRRRMIAVFVRRALVDARDGRVGARKV